MAVLRETKQSYQEIASLYIPDWQKKNKNDLIREACLYKDTEKIGAYYAAIILRYWNKIESYYYKCRLVLTPEDIHSWVVIAIQYCIKHQPWNDETSSIYNDENGPDKVMNRCIECKRLTFYQQLNRFNRKINSELLSLDSLTEDYKDFCIPGVEISTDELLLYTQLVKEFFYKKDYFMSFMIYAILYGDVFSDGELNKRKLASYIKNMDKTCCNIFSQIYEIKLEDVEYGLSFVKQTSSYRMKTNIEYNLIRLKNILKER